MSAVILTLGQAVTDPTGLIKLNRDQLLDGDNDGVLFLCDLAREYTWDGSTPTNGAEVGDISETGDGQWSIESGAVISIAGNGMDLTSNEAGRTACIQAPATVSAALYDSGSSLQHWMVGMYVKLPASGSWWSSGTVGPLVKFAADNYTNGAEHFMVALSNIPGMQIRRGLSTGAVEITTLSGGATITPHQGIITQVIAYRTASGTFIRLRSSGGTTGTSTAAAAANNQNFSALQAQFGSGGGAWTLHGAGAPRIYRVWIEDLAVSGRNPLTVADEDYTRTIARNVFS